MRGHEVLSLHTAPAPWVGWHVPALRSSKDRSLPDGERSGAGEAQLLSRGRAGVAASVQVLAGLQWVLF